MRGNGLEASSYVAIADLDPRVADNMLELLREAGVAAYAEPCLPQQGLLLEVTLPPAPLDRLHVDREEALQARKLLRELLAATTERETGAGAASAAGPSEAAKPGGPATEDSDAEASVDTAGGAGTTADRTPEDDDLIWAQIVEAYERESKSPVNPWPAVEDTDEDDSEGSEDSGGTKARARDGSGSTDGETETEAAETETATTVEQERYVPPPPPPLPKLDPITKLCWGVTLSGPVLMLLAAFANGYVPSWFLPLGVVALVGGFVALVFRMRGGPPDESDDGAVV